MKPGWSRNLETLRGISILMVLIAHSDAIFLAPPAWLTSMLRMLHLDIGVGIFFALSGYIVTATLYQRYLAAGGASGQYAAFIVRRLSRTLPMAVLWACLTLLGTATLNRVGYFGVWETNLSAFWATILQYANFKSIESFGTLGAFGVYWSLAIEEQFYLLLPLIILLVPFRWAVIILIALLAVLFAYPHGASGFVTVRAFWYDPLIVGALIFLLTGPPRETPDATAAWRQAGFWFVIVLLPAGGRMLLEVPGAPSTFFRFGALACGTTLLIAGIYGILRIPPGRLSAVVEWFAARAYGLYLSHFTVSMATRELSALLRDAGWLSAGVLLDLFSFVIWLALTLASTSILYRLIERPLTDLGRQWGDAHIARRAEAAGTPGRRAVS